MIVDNQGTLANIDKLIALGYGRDAHEVIGRSLAEYQVKRWWTELRGDDREPVFVRLILQQFLATKTYAAARDAYINGELNMAAAYQWSAANLLQWEWLTMEASGGRQET
jgi:hypothetical protein